MEAITGLEDALATPLEVRERLVEALELDLVGPWPGHPLAEEMLPGWERPSNWYLTGFLIPVRSAEEDSGDVDADEDLDEPQEEEGEEGGEDRSAAKRRYFPSSIGLSTLVAAGSAGLAVTVRWGDYKDVERPAEDGDGKGEDGDDEKKGRRGSRRVWKRTPQERTFDVPLASGADGPQVLSVPDTGGLECHVLVRSLSGSGLEGRIPSGTRSVSLFLVNDRDPDTKQRDRAYAFQPELEVSCAEPFVPRPDLRSTDAEWDEQVADLHYADLPEFATGHGVSADWDLVEQDCRVLRTRWIPSAEVEKTVPAEIDGVELGMDVLGGLADGAAARSALAPLVHQYRAWIEARWPDAQALGGERRETAEALLGLAAVAANRIERGIAALGDDADALDAFRVANRAVARALRRRNNIDDPGWRPFQLAFLLINLTGIADPDAGDREVVDLLYFPTGGGKTEAYLGLAAFAIVLRRLRNPEAGGLAGAGVSVVMRYTLRLLTLDQLARAAGLVCALELERDRDQARYGVWPFEIGLWVGKAATPNLIGRKGDGRTDTARTRVNQYKADPRGRPSPIPLEECPWCQTAFTAASFSLAPDADQPHELRIVCSNFECDFTRDRPLPIVTVDEPLYRRLPAFLIATVDKFATLPWVGPSGALLGGADRHDAQGFYGAAEPNQGTPLPSPLPAPDLVIQDELHLISGPLGTMAGLYEAAIDGLCRRPLNGVSVAPKIVASTATVRRAQDQIQALFARASTQIFPPPGPDRRDSFFAQTVPASTAPARRYVGVAAPGRNPKVVMRKVWLALMGAAERCYRDAGGHKNHDNPADGYMTVLGYFNSLRELGGARRIVEEEVRNTVSGYGARRRVGEQRGIFQDRKNFNEVVELTSRQPSRLLIRTAANAHFPQVLSALSLPEEGSKADEAVKAQWEILQAVDNAATLAAFRKVPAVAAALDRLSDDEVLAAIDKLKGGDAAELPVKLVELDALLAQPEGYEDDVPINPDFHARRLPEDVWRAAPVTDSLACVIQLHRLREVLALIGFTRFEAEVPDINGEFDTDVTRAELTIEPRWFPAVENRGEGLFLALDPAAVKAWLARPAVIARLTQLADGHSRWAAHRKVERPFPGGPYVLLHTLSHLLIGAVAMRCGYPASSIRERIYVDYEARRYGLMLYTASPDAEGTLGGLVGQARHIATHLHIALRAGWLCSNDPVCAQHAPAEGMEGRWLHGASCHGCTLIAETSCEMRNDYLDRALVVPTLAVPEAAFFPPLL